MLPPSWFENLKNAHSPNPRALPTHPRCMLEEHMSADLSLYAKVTIYTWCLHCEDVKNK
jgi:hypothetical protein